MYVNKREREKITVLQTLYYHWKWPSPTLAHVNRNSKIQFPQKLTEKGYITIYNWIYISLYITEMVYITNISCF